MILDNPPAPVPPVERPWLVAAGAAIGMALAASIGTKLGEWIVEELRHRMAPPPPAPEPPPAEETQS